MPFEISSGSNHAHGRIYIALGANQPYGGCAPLENLNLALGALETAGVRVHATSQPWRTPAWPDPADPPFTNGAAQLETDLSPSGLMELMHAVEAKLGRSRGVRNAPRTLDLDLIDFHGRVERGGEGAPVLPHPRACTRAFVLLPLRQVAPYWTDPVSGHSIDALIAAIPKADRDACRPADGLLCAAARGLKRSPR
jgi:2-amino-4-hydroxy-6-hydroxymethyldihydropteridine diphosphokinase